MKALQFHGKEDIRLDDVEVPTIKSGQVLIRPAFVGICGTDVHEYARGATLIPYKTHPLTGRAAPLTLGHEVSGVVVEVAPDVTTVQVNDRVAIQPILSDDTCYACRQNRPNCCAKQGFYGLSADGGLAEWLVVEARNARKLPDNVDLDIGGMYPKDVPRFDVHHAEKIYSALIEPLAVGWRAVRCNITDETTSALVMGAGPIGLSVMQALKAHKISTIIAADTNHIRKAAARAAGATHFIDPSKEDLAARIIELCSSTAGSDIAIDTAGKQITLDQCVRAVRVGGRIVNIAVWGGPATIMPNDILLREKSYVGSAIYTREDFDAVIDAVASGLIKPRFMITSKIGLTEVVSKGILKLLESPGDDLKILVDVNGSSKEAGDTRSRL